MQTPRSFRGNETVSGLLGSIRRGSFQSSRADVTAGRESAEQAQLRSTATRHGSDGTTGSTRPHAQQEHQRSGKPNHDMQPFASHALLSVHSEQQERASQLSQGQFQAQPSSAGMQHEERHEANMRQSDMATSDPFSVTPRRAPPSVPPTNQAERQEPSVRTAAFESAAAESLQPAPASRLRQPKAGNPTQHQHSSPSIGSQRPRKAAANSRRSASSAKPLTKPPSHAPALDDEEEPESSAPQPSAWSSFRQRHSKRSTAASERPASSRAGRTAPRSATSRQIRVPSATKGSARSDIRERLRGRRSAPRSGVPTSRASSVGRAPASSAAGRLAAGSRSASAPRQPVQQRQRTPQTSTVQVQPAQHVGPARRAAAKAAAQEDAAQAAALAAANAADDESDGGESWAGVGPTRQDVTRSARDAAAPDSSADAEADLLAQLDATHATLSASATHAARQAASGKAKQSDAQKAQTEFNALPLARGRRSSLLPSSQQTHASQGGSTASTWLRQGSSSASARAAVKDAMALSSGAGDRESAAVARVIGSSMLGQHGLSPAGLHLSSASSPNRASPPPPPPSDGGDGSDEQLHSLTTSLSRTAARAGSSKVTTALQSVQAADTEAPLFVRSQHMPTGQSMPAQAQGAVSARLLDHVAPLPPSGDSGAEGKPSTASIYAGLSSSLSAPQSAPQVGKSSATALAARIAATYSTATASRALTARGALDGASDAEWSWEAQLRSAHGKVSSSDVGTNVGAPSSSSLRLLASAARSDSTGAGAGRSADDDDVGGIDVDSLINMTMALGKGGDASSPASAAHQDSERAASPPQFVAPVAAPVQLVGGNGRGMRASKGLIGSSSPTDAQPRDEFDLTGYGMPSAMGLAAAGQASYTAPTRDQDDPMAAVALREQLYSKYGIADLTTAVKSHQAEMYTMTSDERAVQRYTQQYRSQTQGTFSNDVMGHLRATSTEMAPHMDAGLTRSAQPAPAGGGGLSHRSKPGRKGAGALEGISRQAAVSTAAPMRPTLNQTGSMPPLTAARPFASTAQGGPSGGGPASPGSWIARHLPQTAPAAPPQAPASASAPGGDARVVQSVPPAPAPPSTVPTSQPAAPPASPGGQQAIVRNKPPRKGAQGASSLPAATSPRRAQAASNSPQARVPAAGTPAARVSAQQRRAALRQAATDTDSDDALPFVTSDFSDSTASVAQDKPPPPKQRRPTAAQRSPSPTARGASPGRGELSPGAQRRAWAKKRALERGRRALAGQVSSTGGTAPKPVKGGDDLDAEYDSLVAQMQEGVSARWAQAEAAQAEHDHAMQSLKLTAKAAGAAVVSGAPRSTQAGGAAPPPPRRSLLPQDAKVNLELRSKSAARQRGGLVPVKAIAEEHSDTADPMRDGAQHSTANKSVDVFRVTSARAGAEHGDIAEGLRSTAAPSMGIRGSVFIPKQVNTDKLLTRAQRREADTKASHPRARPDLLASDAHGVAATPEAKRGGLVTSPPSAGRVAPPPQRSTRRGSGAVPSSPAASTRVAYSSPEYVHSNTDMAGANISIVGGSGLQSKASSRPAGSAPSRGSLLMQSTASAHNLWAAQQGSAAGTDDGDGSSTTTMSGSDSDSSDGIPPLPSSQGGQARAQPASADDLHTGQVLGTDDTPLSRIRAKASQRAAAGRGSQAATAPLSRVSGKSSSSLVAQAANFMAEES